MFRRLFGGRPKEPEAVVSALRRLSARVEQMNIPVITDERDAGYDMAVDEVLALIDEAIKEAAGISTDDVDYSGGL
jgi:hypothetical protein